MSAITNEVVINPVAGERALRNLSSFMKHTSSGCIGFHQGCAHDEKAVRECKVREGHSRQREPQGGRNPIYNQAEESLKEIASPTPLICMF